MQYSIINYSCDAVHNIPMTYFINGCLYLFTPFTYFIVL